MDAVQSVKQGKLDCVIIDAQPAKAFVEKNDDLKILDDPFELEEYAIALKKDNTELKDKINAALAELKRTGLWILSPAITSAMTQRENLV